MEKYKYIVTIGMKYKIESENERTAELEAYNKLKKEIKLKSFSVDNLKREIVRDHKIIKGFN